MDLIARNLVRVEYERMEIDFWRKYILMTDCSKRTMQSVEECLGTQAGRENDRLQPDEGEVEESVAPL